MSHKKLIYFSLLLLNYVIFNFEFSSFIRDVDSNLYKQWKRKKRRKKDLHTKIVEFQCINDMFLLIINYFQIKNICTPQKIFAHLINQNFINPFIFIFIPNSHYSFSTGYHLKLNIWSNVFLFPLNFTLLFCRI